MFVVEACVWNGGAQPQPCEIQVGVQRGAGSLQSVNGASPARSSTLRMHRTERRGWTESIQLRGQDGAE